MEVAPRESETSRSLSIARRSETGQIAISDSFGASPDQTDGGVLYLDTARPMTLLLGATYHVPVVREDRTRICTIVRENQARTLTRQFDLKFDCLGY
jgi:hypothetical protein